MSDISLEEIDSVVAVAKNMLGLEFANYDVISNRRGSVVLRCMIKNESYALKLGFARSAEIGVGPNPLLLVMRESEVLQNMPHEVCDMYVGHGIDPKQSFSFLLTKWIPGMPLVAKIRELKRQGEDFKLALSSYSKAILFRLSQIHAAGWIHGDLQSDHLLIDEIGNNSIGLIDFAIAQGKQTKTVIPYQGGLVHFNAPEIAQQVIAGGSAIATVQSELFSLASLLFFAATDSLFPAYHGNPRDFKWAELLQIIASRSFNNINLVAPFVEDHLYKLLIRCLDNDPKVRPASAVEALAMLK